MIEKQKALFLKIFTQKITFFLCLIPLMVAFHLSWQKFCLGCTYPQAQIIPFALSYSDSSLFHNDPMVETKFDYISFYPNLIGFFYKFSQSFEPAVYSIQVISMMIAFYFVILILLNTFKSFRYCVFTLLAFPLQVPMFYGYLFHWRTLFTGFNHNGVGFAFGVAAICFWQKNRKICAGIIISVGSYFHALSMFHLFLIFIGASIYEIWNTGGRKIKTFREVKSYGKNFYWALLFIFLTSPCIIVDFLKDRNYTVEDIETFKLINRLDSFPLNWPINAHIQFLGYVLLIANSWYLHRVQGTCRQIQWIIPMIGTSLLLCILSVVGVHYFDSSYIIVAQLNRSTVWICFLGVLMIVPIVVEQFKNNWIGKIGFIFFLVGILFTNAKAPVFIPLLPMAFILFMLNVKRDRNMRIFLFLHLIVICFWTYTQVDRNFVSAFFDYFGKALQENRTSVIAITFIILFSGTLSYFLYERSKKNILTQVLTFLVGMGLVYSIYKERNDFLPRIYLEWQEVQRWVKENSESEDKVVTHPNWVGFRVYSQRTPVVEWQDGTQLYFSSAYGSKYRERMLDMGFESGKPLEEQAFFSKSLTRERLIFLKTKYSAKFYIFPKYNSKSWTRIDHDLQLPVLFENKFFSVMSLKDLNLN